MPVPRLPPTPGASLDLEGKIATSQAPTLFLGPAAREDGSERNYSATPSSDNASESSYHPASPIAHGATASKRKSTTSSKKNDDDFNLPPPPTRTRKIIQMKPGASEDGSEQATASNTKGGKKRGGNAGATAAGRKIARKTAHSLIERRRRSKMNEEFGVLKDMIPACRGQEMHKLAILQASIEYLRYLERCIGDLKSASHRASPELDVADDDTPMEDDDEPEDTPQKAPTPIKSFTPVQPPTYSPRTLPSFSSIATTIAPPPMTSPVFKPLDNQPRARQASLSSSHAPSPYILPGGSSSAAASPLFPAQHRQSGAMNDAIQRFTLSSPALEPQDAASRQRPPRGSECSDREAMAALLMLNKDRRPEQWVAGPSAAKGRGGVSVQDLLTSS